MADLQKYFEQFHGKIRLDFDANDQLREKRDIVLDKIKNSLEKNGRPGFERLLQGSYQMKTGVFPGDGREYDIDVGLVFDFDEELPDAADPRGWILDAVSGHTDSVVEKAPCIRVHYKDSPPYHLDLVVYGRINGQYQLATRDGWVSADPERLLLYVADAHARFKGTERGGIDQFRRVVRYLKRWGDVRVPGDAEEKPTGLAYTLLAAESLVKRTLFDGTPDDASALRELARGASGYARIVAKKPTPEYEDMFGRLTVAQMDDLKRDLAKLADAIDAAREEPEPCEACKLLVPLLGDDFPVPPEGEGGKRTKAPAIVPSSSSA